MREADQAADAAPAGTTAMRRMRCGGPMGRFIGLGLAVVALAGLDQAWGQQEPITRQTLVTAIERGPGPAKGRDDAPITIVEFSDFQCSFCWKFWKETLPRIEAEYIKPGKARLVYRHMVLLGPVSEHAAEAASCAQEQGKFWAYHDALFERHGRLSPHAGLMEQLRLDPTAFTACLASGRHKERALGESAVARGLGASGTPAFLINGKLLIGAQPFETFKRILDALATEVSVPTTVKSGAASRP